MEKTRVTVKTPDGEILPILTAAEVAEMEKHMEKLEEWPKLGLENDAEEAISAV